LTVQGTRAITKTPGSTAQLEASLLKLLP